MQKINVQLTCFFKKTFVEMFEAGGKNHVNSQSICAVFGN